MFHIYLLHKYNTSLESEKSKNKIFDFDSIGKKFKFACPYVKKIWKSIYRKERGASFIWKGKVRETLMVPKSVDPLHPYF